MAALESCICVLAHPGHPKTTTEPNTDQLTIQTSVTIGAVSKKPLTKTSPKIHYTRNKTLTLSRRAFLSSDRAEQLRIISTTIESLGIPFPMHHHEKSILWGALDFPSDADCQTRFQNLDEIKARLLDVVCRCAENSKTGYMDVRIRKVEKVSDELYRELLGSGERYDQPLGDWVRENANDVNLRRDTCLGLIQELAMDSPMDNKLFGLRSVRIDEEDECSICLKGLEKGKMAIRMPCGHVFHGFCILRWIGVKRNCPFCRSLLENKVK